MFSAERVSGPIRPPRRESGQSARRDRTLSRRSLKTAPGDGYAACAYSRRGNVTSCGGILVSLSESGNGFLIGELGGMIGVGAGRGSGVVIGSLTFAPGQVDSRKLYATGVRLLRIART